MTSRPCKYITIVSILFFLSGNQISNAANQQFNYGILPFSKSLTDTVKKEMKGYYDSLEILIAHELRKFKDIEDIRTINYNQKIIFDAECKSTAPASQTTPDPVNDLLNQISETNKVDGLILGQLYEDLSANKLKYIIRLYSLADHNYQTISDSIDIKSISRKSIKDFVDNIIANTESLISKASSSRQNQTKLFNTITSPSGVKEETIDDLLALGGNDPSGNLSTATTTGSTSSDKNRSPNLEDIKDVYRMISDRGFYINTANYRHKLCYDGKEEYRKKGEQLYRDFKNDFGLKDADVAKLEKIDKDRIRDHGKAVRQLASEFKIDVMSLKKRLKKYDYFRTFKKNPKYYLYEITSTPKQQSVRGKYILCYPSKWKPENIKYDNIPVIIEHYNKNTNYDTWKIPTIDQLLALTGGVNNQLFPIGKPAIYWTSSKTGDGGVWMLEKELAKVKNRSRPGYTNYLRYTFVNSNRYDPERKVISAYLIPVLICK